MTRPAEAEYAPFYRGYVAHVGEEEILPVLRSQLDHLDVLLGQVTPERETYAYAEGKWSIRELTGHLIDAERVFGYRAFCIARGESRNLPGFDEKEYLLRAPYYASRAFRTSRCCAIWTSKRGCALARRTTRKFPCARWPSSWPVTCAITWEFCASVTGWDERL